MPIKMVTYLSLSNMYKDFNSMGPFQQRYVILAAKERETKSYQELLCGILKTTLRNPILLQMGVLFAMLRTHAPLEAILPTIKKYFIRKVKHSHC